MKAEICVNGTLIVTGENSIEAYALRKWLEDNKVKCQLIVVPREKGKRG